MGMAQMSNNMQPGHSNFQNGRSFNDRVEERGRFQNRRQDQQNRSTGDTEMGEDGQPIKNEEGGDENTNKEGGKPAAETMCRFNKLCKNPECGFAHSGPVTFTGKEAGLSVNSALQVRSILPEAWLHVPASSK